MSTAFVESRHRRSTFVTPLTSRGRFFYCGNDRFGPFQKQYPAFRNNGRFVNQVVASLRTNVTMETVTGFELNISTDNMSAIKSLFYIIGVLVKSTFATARRFS